MEFVRRNSRAEALRRESTAVSQLAQRKTSGGLDDGRKSSISSPAASLYLRLGSLSLGKTRSKSESVIHIEHASSNLGELFISLPVEMQLQVLSNLSIPSILACRLVSRSFASLISTNAFHFSQTALRQQLPSYCSQLLPLPADISEGHNPLIYILSVHRAHKTSVVLANIVAGWIETEIMRVHTQRARRKFLPSRLRLEAKLKPALFIISSWFCRWRLYFLRSHLRDHMLPDVDAGAEPDLECVVTEFLKSCTDEQLLVADDVYRLLLAVYTRQLRPPSYATGLERAVRGWTGQPPPWETLRMTLAIGGLSTATKILSAPSYASKCKMADTFPKRLQQVETIRWKDNWHELLYGPFRPVEEDELVEPPDLEPLSRHLTEFYFDPWWVSVEGLFLKRGLVTPQTKAKSTGQIIRDLLEYDVLEVPRPGTNHTTPMQTGSQENVNDSNRESGDENPEGSWWGG